MAIKAIGFDYGGVITTRPRIKFDQGAADALGVELETFKKAYFNHNQLVQTNVISWDEAIYIDDTPRSLERASEIGFQPIVFTGYENLTAELTKRGVL